MLLSLLDGMVSFNILRYVNFRAEVCYHPIGGYDGGEPWRITLEFDIPINNFNANQARIYIKNN